MSVAHFVSPLLQLSVLPGLQALMQLVIVISILHTQPDDLLGGLCICEIKCWRTVELDILRWNSSTLVEHISLNVEDLHTQSSRLWDAIIKCWIARLAAIPHGYGVTPALCKHALLEMGRQIVLYDHFAFDKTLSSGVGSYYLMRQSY